MNNPEVTLACFEECEPKLVRPLYRSLAHNLEDRDKRGTIRHKHEGDGNFEEVFFGRLVRLMSF